MIVNGLVFLAQLTFQNRFPIYEWFAQHHFLSKDFKPHQLLTYMFMHSTQGFGHILFNMLALFMFGTKLEMVWGAKRFLTFYLICGIGAGIISGLATLVETYPAISDFNFLRDHPTIRNLNMLLSKYPWINSIMQINTNAVVDPDSIEVQKEIIAIADHLKDVITRSTTVGASGAIFGILAGVAYLFPNDIINIYFVIPLKLKWFVLIYAALELYQAYRNDPQDQVAHMAHLGGGLVGFLMVYFSYRRGNRRRLF